jgi:HEPN domain-containing protein
MSPKLGERRFDKKYSLILINIAKDDHFAAAALGKNSKVRKETALFLAQQCIEKSLKAVLCHLGRPVPLVHDVGALIAKMPDDVEPPYGYQLTRFNDYAGILRYENGGEKLTSKDVKEALAIAEKVYKWASQKISKK